MDIKVRAIRHEQPRFIEVVDFSQCSTDREQFESSASPNPYLHLLIEKCVRVKGPEYYTTANALGRLMFGASFRTPYTEGVGNIVCDNRVRPNSSGEPYSSIIFTTQKETNQSGAEHIFDMFIQPTNATLEAIRSPYRIPRENDTRQEQNDRPKFHVVRRDEPSTLEARHFTQNPIMDERVQAIANANNRKSFSDRYILMKGRGSAESIRGLGELMTAVSLSYVEFRAIENITGSIDGMDNAETEHDGILIPNTQNVNNFYDGEQALTSLITATNADLEILHSPYRLPR